jgi:hypothetical protein
MKLTDLDPHFIRYETRIDTYTVIDGDHETWRARGCPTKEVTGPREYSIRVETLAEAQGIRFLCPTCYAKNSGPVGTHGIDVAFHGRGVLDHQGSHNSKGEPSRWHVSGDGLENLTMTPSIDGGCWHGHVTNGDAK